MNPIEDIKGRDQEHKDIFVEYKLMTMASLESTGKDTLPGNVIAKNLDSDPYKLHLSWTAPTNPPLKGYLVTANLDEQNVFEKQTKDLQIFIDGLRPSTEYICNVCCILGNNEKIALDNPAKATTADVSDTHKPQNLRPEVSERKIYLTWDPKYIDENLHYECKIENMNTNKDILCTVLTQTSAQALGLQRGSYRAEVMTFVDKKKLASNCIENIAINRAPKNISTEQMFVGHNNNRCNVKWDLPDLNEEKDNFECIGTAANLSLKEKGEWKNAKEIFSTDNNTAMFDQLSDRKQYQVELVTTYEDTDTRKEYKSSRTEQFNTVDWKMKTTYTEEGAKCKWKACYQYEDYKLLFRVGDSYYGPFEAQKCKRGKFYKYHFDSKEFQIQTKNFQVEVECNNGQIKSGFMEQNIDKKHLEVEIKAEANGFNPQQIDIRRVSSKVPQKIEVKVYRRGNDTPFQSSYNMDGTMMVDGLEPNTEYTCEAAFHLKKYGIINSNCCTVTTLPESVFLPQSVNVHKDDFNPFQIKLRWDSPDKKPNHYFARIYRNNEEKDKAQVLKCEHTFSQLEPNTEYECLVECELRNGGRLSTNRYKGITATRNDTLPGNIKAKNDDADPYRLQITWTAPKHPPTLGYLVTVHKEDTEVFKKKTEELQMSVTDLQPSTKYECNVHCLHENDVKVSSDKPASPNTSAVSSTHKPRNLTHTTDGRKLTIKWDTPKYTGEGMKYECTVNSVTKETIFPDTTSSTQAEFLQMRKGSYTATVAVKVKNQTLASDCIKNIDIAPERNDHFDIIKYGAPENVTTEPKMIGNNGHQCIVTWALPDLQLERVNFEHTNTSAILFLLDNGKKRVKSNMSTENCRTIFNNLRDGQQYSVEIVTTYKDTDTLKTFDSTTSESFSTAIQKPDGIEVSWKSSNLMIKWNHQSRAETLYKVRIYDPLSKMVLYEGDTHSLNHTIQMKINRYHYGLVCDFEVEALQHGGMKSSNSAKDILIGGKYAVTKVKLEADENDERRKAKLGWKSPQSEPKNYKILLYEGQDSKIVKMREEKEDSGLTDLHHVICGLKPSTSYICSVVAEYANVKTIRGESFSSLITTKKRITTAIEQELTYGQPSVKVEINDDTTQNETLAKISWEEVKLSENHKFVNFEWSFRYSGAFAWLRETMGKGQSQRATEAGCTEQHIEKGRKYLFTITSNYEDIDTKSKLNKVVVETIGTKPNKAKIQPCHTKDDIVTFSWTAVSGAAKYTLEVKDVLDDRIFINMAKPVSENDAHQAFYKIEEPLSNDLRVGKWYSMRVTVVGESGEISITDWRNQLLGGDKVPCNVRVKLNPENPYRSVNIRLDEPQCGITPEYYEVRAVPKEEKILKEKKEKFTNNNITFHYLVQNAKYQFKVRAIFPNGERSEESSSEEIKTSKKIGKTQGIEISGVKKSTFNMGDINLPDHVKKATYDDRIGQVLNLNVDYMTTYEKDDRDPIQITWQAPTFQNNQEDFRIDRYEVVLTRIGPGTPKKSSTKKLGYNTSIKNGVSYKLAVITHYEDIDEQKDLESQARELEIFTRPKKPLRIEPKLNYDAEGVAEGLTITWNSCDGASKGYKVEIFQDKDGKIVDKSFDTYKTEKTVTFDDDFGVGSKYKVKITAKGERNLNHSGETKYRIIGGKKVPRNVKTTFNGVENPNKEVFVSWEAPEEKVDSYKVYAVEEYGKRTELCCKHVQETSIKCQGLKAGCEYRFKVVSVDGQGNASVGSISSVIKTDPSPSQVQNVSAKNLPNSSPAVVIKWDPLDSEKSGEKTIYKIKLVTTQPKDPFQIIEQEVIDVTHYTMHGLLSGQEYEVSVSGGNSEGFGRDSEIHKLTTVFGRPHNLTLKLDEKFPSEKIHICFREAARNPIKYRINLWQETTPENMHEQHETSCATTFESLVPNSVYKAQAVAIYGAQPGPAVISDTCLTGEKVFLNKVFAGLQHAPFIPPATPPPPRFSP